MLRVFFNDAATTEIYTLSLHDALPILGEVYLARDRTLGRDVALKILRSQFARDRESAERFKREALSAARLSHPSIVQVYEDRKSTRLNSSHANISYAVFCLKKQHLELS